MKSGTVIFLPKGILGSLPGLPHTRGSAARCRPPVGSA